MRTFDFILVEYYIKILKKHPLCVKLLKNAGFSNSGEFYAYY